MVATGTELSGIAPLLDAAPLLPMALTAISVAVVSVLLALDPQPPPRGRAREAGKMEAT